MQRVSRRAVAVAAVLCTVVAAACGSSSKPESSTTSTAPASASAALKGSLNVSAASSLTGAFDALKSTLETANTDLHLTMNYGGSQTLATQITEGEPADVFASADQKNMQKL